MSEKGMKVLQSKRNLLMSKSVEHNLCESYIYSSKKLLVSLKSKESQEQQSWSGIMWIYGELQLLLHLAAPVIM